MDTNNLITITEVLMALGFTTSAARKLILKACFRQQHFVITERMLYGNDTINYQLFFKADSTKKLFWSHYDATLKKAIEIPASVINGIDVRDVERRMSAIDWYNHAHTDNVEELKISDKNTWRQEGAIEGIIIDLETLAATAEGSYWSNTLKDKFWCDLPFQDMVGDLSILKSRNELLSDFISLTVKG